jgi:hypothetical protein
MLLEVIESTEGCASNQEVKEVCARMQVQLHTRIERERASELAREVNY